MGMDVLCLVSEMVGVMTQPASVGVSACTGLTVTTINATLSSASFLGGGPMAQRSCALPGALCNPLSPQLSKLHSTPPHTCPLALHLGPHSWALQPLGVQPPPSLPLPLFLRVPSS